MLVSYVILVMKKKNYCRQGVAHFTYFPGVMYFIYFSIFLAEEKLQRAVNEFPMKVSCMRNYCKYT